MIAGMASRSETEVLGTIAEHAGARGLHVAVAESLACGMLASTLGRGPHARDWLCGGVVSYTPEVKQSVLGVTPGPVVTARCAQEMAAGVRELLGADLAVSTTGVGGPDPQEGRPAGTVFLGWCDARGTGFEEHRFDGDPQDVLDQTTHAALDLVVRLLEGQA